MKAKLKRWNEALGDERAVSPVIGVILMVAITVILAAVIGTFVLDLGQSAGQSAPQASLSVSTSTSDNTVTIEHTGGDSINAEDTRIRVEHSDGSTGIWNEASSSAVMSVGGSTTFDVEDDGDSSGDLNALQYDSANSDTITISSGDQLTVTIIDTQSQRQIFETTVTA